MTIEERIRSDVEARIRSGEWRPGHRIPFEHELVLEYGCSRGTVGKSLAALARSGLIERRRKAGSFVAHPHVHAAVLEVPDLAQIIAARGETYKWERSVRRLASEVDLNLESQITLPALVVEGVHHCADQPFCLEERLISLANAPSAQSEDFVDASPGTWLLHHIPWTNAQHRIAAVGATVAQSRMLNINVNAACLSIERSTWQMGRPVTYVRQLFPGDRYDLVAEFQPGGAASRI